MGSTNLPENKQYSQPIIFRSQGLYVCGLCLRGYSTHASSHACLCRCARHIATERGVEVFVSGLCQRYRCCFCMREYVHENIASACVAECVGRIFAKENLFEKRHGAPKKCPPIDLKLSKNVQERKTFLGYLLRSKKTEPVAKKKLQMERKVRDPNALSEEDQFNLSSPIPLESLPNSDEVPFETELEYQPSAPAKKREVIKYRTPNQKPFQRDGAKYKCSVCLITYFTGDEVKECFFSHPLLEAKSV